MKGSFDAPSVANDRSRTADLRLEDEKQSDTQEVGSLQVLGSVLGSEPENGTGEIRKRFTLSRVWVIYPHNPRAGEKELAG